MRRLGLALGAYALIAATAWWTLPAKLYVAHLGYVPMSAPVVLLMALLAFKSVLHHRHTMHAGEEARTSNAELEGRE
jgi:hypothetical protein